MSEGRRPHLRVNLRADGYAMAALLVAVGVMSVLLSVALPLQSQLARREREEELIWRGQQYARAVGLFQRRYASTFPANVDVLVEQRFLRKKYKDPITHDEFQVLLAGDARSLPGGSGGPGQGPGSGRGAAGARSPTSAPIGATPAAAPPAGGVVGVVSKSRGTAIKVFNGRSRYNEWAFVWVAPAPRAMPPGEGGRGGTGRGRPPEPRDGLRGPVRSPGVR